eukprot:m.440579 g.440579  ORF g.440579 m.440579 type:complete len:344 (+) comp18538_c0_seq1:1758-2789(+)
MGARPRLCDSSYRRQTQRPLPRDSSVRVLCRGVDSGLWRLPLQIGLVVGHFVLFHHHRLFVLLRGRFVVAGTRRRRSGLLLSLFMRVALLSRRARLLLLLHFGVGLLLPRRSLDGLLLQHLAEEFGLELCRFVADAVLAQPTLSVERSHGTRSCRRDRLAVHLVRHVARREDAVHGGVRRMRLHHQVPVFVHLQPTPDNVRIRLVPNGDKRRRARNVGLFAGVHVLHHNVGEQVDHLAVFTGLPLDALVLAHKLVNGRVPHDRDLVVLQHALRQDVAGSESVAAVDHRHFAGRPREDKSVLHGRVPSANHHDVLISIKKTVARCAGRNTPASVLLFALDPKPL